MYEVLKKINEDIRDAVNSRIPSIKITVAKPDENNAKVIDVQHLDKNNAVSQGINIIKQDLTRYHTTESDIKFIPEQKNMLSNLSVIITNKVNTINISIEQLVPKEAELFQRALSIFLAKRVDPTTQS